MRPSSLQKPEVRDLEKRGIKIVGIDLSSSEEHLASLLEDIDVLISSINTSQLTAQIPLIDAAKSAGVKRFVPCNFATVAPPKGVLSLRDLVSLFRHIREHAEHSAKEMDPNGRKKTSSTTSSRASFLTRSLTLAGGINLLYLSSLPVASTMLW